MKNKELQEKRMRDYFIQATKEILKAEGLKGVSVRNVADKAGYSYATMYNYFKDINELIFLCVSDFQDECISFIAYQTKESVRGLEKISMIVVSYIKYFMEYPGIFELFYLEKVGDFGHNQEIINKIARSLPEACEAEWNYCIENKLVAKERAASVSSRLRYTVVGLLLFYLNRRTPGDYQEFLNEAKKQIDDVLETSCHPVK